MDFVRKGLQRKAHSEVITERGLVVQSPTANFDRNLQERPKDIKKSDFLDRILKRLLS
jgi:hypothetical protein